MTRHDKRVRATGLLAAALAALFICFGVASATSPLATADETGHVDYAIQIWNGHLPVFEQGVKVRPPPPAVLPPVQWESQHPPLFYAIAAPLAGPLANAGHWKAADLAVRALNSVITLLTILVIAWAAGLLRPRDRGGWVVGVGAVATTIGPVIFVGGSAYGDPLNTLLTAATLGLAIQLIKSGPTLKRIAMISAVSAAGAATNAEFVLPLVIVVVVTALVVLLQSRGTTARRIVLAVVAAAAPLAASAASAGWFYLRNKRLTGNYSGAQPAYARAHLNGAPRSFSSVFHNRDFWNTQYSLLRHPLDGRSRTGGLARRLDTDVTIWLFVVCVIAGVLIALVYARRAGRRGDIRQLASYGVLLAMLIIDFGYEYRYTMSGGGSVSRYILPAVLPLCVLIAAGLRIVGPRARPWALAGYLALCYGFFSAWLLRQPHTGNHQPTGVPWALMFVIPVLLAVALVAQVRALQVTNTVD